MNECFQQAFTLTCFYPPAVRQYPNRFFNGPQPGSSEKRYRLLFQSGQVFNQRVGSQCLAKSSTTIESISSQASTSQLPWPCCNE